MLTKKLAEFWRIYFLIFLALLTLAIWSVYFNEPDDNLHIFFLDVGQGDAELLQKGNWQILIDGGPDNSIIEKLGNVMPIEDREIEEVILTHPHADHVTGLNAVLERYKVDKIKYSEVDYESNVYNTFKKLIKEKNIPTYSPKIGETEDVFGSGKITWLWPGSQAQSYINNLNNTSEVMHFDFGSINGLFTGDCEKECWQQITDQNKDLITNVTFLKVAHHGSNTGSDSNNIPLISPQIAIISCGKDNKYGFPHKETLDVLQKVNADIYRTDLLGTIDISTDGKSFSTTPKLSR